MNQILNNELESCQGMKPIEISEDQFAKFFKKVPKVRVFNRELNRQWRQRLKGYKSNGTTILLQEGEVCRKFWFVLSGLVAKYKVGIDGERRVAQLRRSGEFVTDILSYVSVESSAYAMMAYPGTVLLEIECEDIEEMRCSSPYNMKLVNSVLVKASDFKYVKTMYMSLRQRQRILFFYDWFSEVVDEQEQLIMPYEDVASYLFIKRDSFQKHNRALQKQGLI